MKTRLVFIFCFLILLSFFYSCKKSTNPIATHGNRALINATLMKDIDALLNLQMVIHAGRNYLVVLIPSLQAMESV